MPDTSVLGWPEYVELLAGLLALVNPISSVPIFLSLTRAHSAERRKRVALSAAVASFIVLMVSLFLGQAVLDVFGINIASFRVAGGLLIFLIALSMMQSNTPADAGAEASTEAADEGSVVGVVPLAIPILVGPGAISTVILYAQRAPSMTHYVLIGLAIATLSLLIYLAYRFAPMIGRLLGTTGMSILSRVMGLIIAAVAVEFVVQGLTALFPALTR